MPVILSELNLELIGDDTVPPGFSCVVCEELYNILNRLRVVGV